MLAPGNWVLLVVYNLMPGRKPGRCVNALDMCQMRSLRPQVSSGLGASQSRLCAVEEQVQARARQQEAEVARLHALEQVSEGLVFRVQFMRLYTLVEQVRGLVIQGRADPPVEAVRGGGAGARACVAAAETARLHALEQVSLRHGSGFRVTVRLHALVEHVRVFEIQSLGTFQALLVGESRFRGECDSRRQRRRGCTPWSRWV